MKAVSLALLAVLACAAPPKPEPLPPAPFVCAGPDSVPAFDAVANELVNAAMVADDAGSAARIDDVAKRRGVPVVLCVIGEILPDLREAPEAGRHLETWRANNDPAAVRVSAVRVRRAFLVRGAQPIYLVEI